MTIRAWVVMSAIGLASACSSNTSENMSMVTPSTSLPTAGTMLTVSGRPATAGSSAGRSAAGTAGMGATAGAAVGGSTPPSAGSPSAAGAGAATGVPCGSKQCADGRLITAWSPTAPVGCCVDPATSTCGFKVNGTCTPPLPAAPECMVSFGTVGTCCIAATSTCGVDASAYGMGCLDVSASMGGAKMTCSSAGAAGGSAPAAGAAGTATAGTGAAAGAGGTALAGSGGSGAAGHAAGSAGTTTTAGVGGNP